MNQGDQYLIFTLDEKRYAMGLFSQINLAASGYSSVMDRAKKMDMIFCRNGLMYFSQQIHERIIVRFSDESINSLKKSLYLDQDFVLVYFALGNLNTKLGRAEESRKYFENGLSLLSSMEPEKVLPYSEGIQAGRLLEVVQSIMKEEKAI